MIEFLKNQKVLVFLFLIVGLVGVACGDDDDDNDDMMFDARQVTYELAANSNDGPVSDGVAATATFQEFTADQTIVRLELLNGSTNTTVSHPAHIHANTAAEGGNIVYFLGPLDGLGAAPGVSYHMVNASFDELIDFNGYINIHESNAAIGNVVSQGNIGSNAEAEVQERTIDIMDNGRTQEYTLDSMSNGGAIPNGLGATATFTELNSEQTLVTLAFDNGTTNTNLCHPAHIHMNSASEGGDIAYFLGPIDGLGAAEGLSYAIVDESFDFLMDYDGYINIHQSNADIPFVVSQGNIGSNAQ
jgi:hypothetical protein